MSASARRDGKRENEEFSGKEAYVSPGTCDSGLSCFIQIRILKNDLRCLSPQFKENGLQILTGKFGNDGSDRSRPGEIDFPCCRMSD